MMEPNATKQTDWESLERQDWHLWILAVLLMFVLGVSLLSFMFPSVFWLSPGQTGPTPERAFFGFCLLLALTLVYMLQRQAAVRRLKRSLYQAQVAAIAAEEKLHLISLTALPEVSQFRDSLAMEYRRASHAGDHLAVILVDLPAASEEDMGRTAHLLHGMLRPHEALFRVTARRLGIILPAMRPADASLFATQLTDQLRRLLPREDVSSTVIVYPEQAGSLTELEGRLRTLVS